MRRIASLFALGMSALLMPSHPDAQDPKAVSPDMYQVFFENDEIRIIQVTYQPGQRDAPHSHPKYIAYVLEPGTLRVHTKGGETQLRTVERGQTIVQEPVEQHWAENISDSVVRAVFLEIKN